jgi:hypothetical protein
MGQSQTEPTMSSHGEMKTGDHGSQIESKTVGGGDGQVRTGQPSGYLTIG